MTDEDVIKRRLLIDGDGTGEDRRLNLFLKSLTKWCESTDDTPEESKSAHDKMLAQLSQCEFAMTKSLLCSSMMGEELKKYESLSNILLSGIDTAKHSIEKSKADWNEAKKVRKNKTEYDVLAKVISEQPDRRVTAEQLYKLKQELSNLEKSRSDLEGRLCLRRKQFHVMVNSIHQLQAMLEEQHEGIDSSLDDVHMLEEDVK